METVAGASAPVLSPVEPVVGWPLAIRVGLRSWLFSALGYLALAAVARGVGSTPPVPGSSLSWPFRVFARYDAGHFLRIAQYGYLSRGKGDGNVAFFPGYPLAGRYLADLLGVGHPTQFDYQFSLALLAWLSTAVAAVLLYELVGNRWGRSVATASVAALLAGPYAFFFFASYSEGPFLAFALGAWRFGLLGARRRAAGNATDGAWWWAGALCAAATAVRVNGLFLLLGLIVLYLGPNQGAPRPTCVGASLRDRVRATLRLDGVALLLPLFVVLVYFGWLRVNVGRWDAWSDAQRRGWDRYTSWPWQSLGRTLRFLRQASTPSQYLQTSMELLFAAFLLVALVVLARRRCWAEFAYVAAGATSLMTSSFYQSIPRTSIVAFPLAILVARWMVESRRRWLVWSVALGSIALLVTNVSFFVRGYPAG